MAIAVTAPALTTFDADGKAVISPLTLVFSTSAAALEWVNKPVNKGITLTPKLDGEWRFEGDNKLVFTPKVDWPVGAEVHVHFDKPGPFDPAKQLAQQELSFDTAAFAVSVESAEFYQDPLVPAAKQGLFTLAFTHAVDTNGLEGRLSIRRSGQSAGVLGLGAQTTPFTLSYDKLHLHAYVHTENLAIPSREQHLYLNVAEGLRAARGGNSFATTLQSETVVPGLYSLAVTSAATSLVDNERFEPEPVLLIELNQLVDEQAMAGQVQAWILPAQNPRQKQPSKRAYAWYDAAEVNAEVLKVATPLALSAVPAAETRAQSFGYKYVADVGRYVYVTTRRGLVSFGGYQLAQDAAQIVRVPAFPPNLRILHSGSLLTLSGEKRVGVMIRDVPRVKVTIGRLLPEQLQHLVSQSDGSFTNPEFYGRLSDENITERFERIIDVPLPGHGKPYYEGIDLSTYLSAAPRRGIFLFKVQAAPAKPVTDETNMESADKSGDSAADSRLILVTDLGLLAKRNLDGSREVFVQSLVTGLPVSGANIKVIAKNGQTLVTEATDDSGRVHLSTLDEFKHERQPLLYLAEKGNDLSFLPIDRADRWLDLSRFDVGGAASAVQPGQLSAYLFSERGLYRPGETFHIGMIVKPAGWDRPLAGVPLEAVVYDPLGLVVKRSAIALTAAGFETLEYATRESSASGTYRISLGLPQKNQGWQEIGSAAVQVRDFQPDRMRVTARLSQAAADGWISPDELKVLVNAQNLFGTAAQGRRIEASLTLRPSFPALRGFAEYTFYDPQHAKEEFSDTLPAQTSDEKGDAQFELGLKRYARATYQIDFVARAFEATGGRGVTAQTSALVSSVPYLVGWKADGALNFIARSAARGVEMIAVDAALKKVAAAGLKLERVERKYVSILTKQPSGVYKYESHQKETVLETKDASITAAGVTLALDTGTPGDFALVLRDAGHVELSRVEYSVAGAANLSRSLERNAELAVVLNKKDFDPGEDISISVRAPYVGSGLITIERDKVYAATWFKSTSTSSVQKIRIPKDFAGNGYVTVQYLRDPSSDEIFMSPLTYGVAPFSVSLAKHENELKFTVPAQSRPGTAVAMHLQAQYPAKVVVFAVDEGILQVARYKAPDPLGFFFQKRALQVRTSQILDLVLPEYRKLLSAMAPGGDEEAMRGRNLNPFRRRGEKSVVYWSGLLDVGKAGVDLKYEVPDYFSGSLKFFAVAVNADTIGVYQGRNIVRGDFVISPNAPLMLAPGDEVEVSASVANNLRGSGKAAMPSVQLQTGPGLTILGEDRVKLAIAENSEGVTRFHLKANDKLGPEQLKFLISLNGATAARTVALSIRPANPRSTTLTTGSLEDNSRDEPLKHNFYAEQRQVEAALAFNPLVLVRGIAAWLNHYDYYCSEQLLSQAVPAMLILSNPELGRIVGKPGQDGAQALAALIATLRTRQTTAGAYALWPNGEADEYVSAYVQDLLLEARQRGAEVPADMVLSGNEYLRGLAKTDATTLGAARARAYAIYLLTRQGEVTSNLVAGLQRTLDERFAGAWRSDILAGYLAATFQLQQQLREGVRLIEPLEKILRGKQQTVNDTWLDYYDSSVRDAVVVRLIARHFPNRVRDLPADMVDRLAEPIRVGHFNTHSAAVFLLALDALGSRSLAKADGLLSIRELSGDGTAAVLAAPLNATRSASLTLAAQQARFTAVGSGRAWFALTESGFERRPVNAVVSAGIEVFREYRNASGQVVTEARVGEDLTAIVRIRALDQRWIPDVAVVDLLPGGFEPVVEGEATSRIQSDSLDATRWVPANVEWREDRLVLYGAVSPEVRSYIYHVRPTSVGSFVVPAISAESMYRPALQARGVTGLFKVTKP